MGFLISVTLKNIGKKMKIPSMGVEDTFVSQRRNLCEAVKISS